MSKSLYTIRGFKPLSETAFNAFGVLEQFATFEEKTVEKQHQALVELLTGPLGISARTLTNVSNTVGLKNLVDVRPDKTIPADEVIVLNLTLEFGLLTKDHLKEVRPVVVEAFTRWAEKSRVRGSRGWRVSAVRTPTFEKNDSGNGYLLKTQILLSNAIFYDQDTVKVGVDTAIALKDLENLKRHINKQLDAMSFVDSVDALRYDHSVIGKGVL